MKQELKSHLLPLAIIYFFASLTWIFAKVSFFEFLFSFFGFILGAFFLDLDHVLYWFYLKPNLEESRLAQTAFKNKDYPSVLKLLESTHKTHTNLVFHHYFFQVVLVLISFFVFTSTTSSFAMAFLLSLNIHLLVDEINDYQTDRLHLQDWLFAREKKQLPLDYLKQYLAFFVILSLIFTYLLIRSKT